MKKCSYCGQENSDEASFCSVCRTPFEEEAGQKPRRPIRLGKHFGLRLLIAGCVWLIVSGISLGTGRRNAEGSIAWQEQRTTRLELENLKHVLTLYTQKSNSAPANFAQLLAFTNEFSWMPGKSFVDNWGHPLVLTNDGTNCVIISYGRDGKPGGIGVDFDLTTENPKPKEAIPTFGQFLENERDKGIIFSAIFCGALAAMLSLLTVRLPDLTLRGLFILGLSLGATLLGAIFVAGIITVLHIPNGH